MLALSFNASAVEPKEVNEWIGVAKNAMSLTGKQETQAQRIDREMAEHDRKQKEKEEKEAKEGKQYINLWD